MSSIPYHFDDPRHVETVALNEQMVQDAAIKSVNTGGKLEEYIRPPSAEESTAIQQAMTAAPEIPEIAPTEGAQAPEIPEIEMAAIKFTKLLPFVKKMTMAMTSQKGVARVMHALAEFPLGAGKPRLLNDAERQLFMIMQDLAGHKTKILNEIIKNNANNKPVETEEENKDESSSSNG